MTQITRLYGLVTAVLALVAFLSQGQGQTPNGTLVYQDDFSVSNSVWQCALTDTYSNETAIAASYGKIEEGYLQLKANVGCGWNYLLSWASLDIPLPDEFAIEYSANKLQWCGSFNARITASNIVSGLGFRPYYDISTIDGGSFINLVYAESATNDLSVYATPITASAPNGQWYNHRIEKRHNSLRVYVNNALQYSYNGNLFSGGFLQLSAWQAGSTAQIDNLRIYELPPSLSIEVAAVRLRWLAESNVNYQVQWSTDMQAWSNLPPILGTGTETNLVDWTDGPMRFYRLTVP